MPNFTQQITLDREMERLDVRDAASGLLVFSAPLSPPALGQLLMGGEVDGGSGYSLPAPLHPALGAERQKRQVTVRVPLTAFDELPLRMLTADLFAAYSAGSVAAGWVPEISARVPSQVGEREMTFRVPTVRFVHDGVPVILPPFIWQAVFQ
ncbi:hypothetical protein IHN63_00075 [Deinococcus sp. 6YEL10]|uniref:hypothetical protein n=1 Tax=Deinococcus sp. 6YEL10 TaxID=2745870 RepID=UPI001E4F592A|nr:hypothetical protein [Deinococcus sp. 6YEL10]MCD0159694.1 hypothetical protein [Deinococcus sp. 6YEL10]